MRDFSRQANESRHPGIQATRSSRPSARTQPSLARHGSATASTYESLDRATGPASGIAAPFSYDFSRIPLQSGRPAVAEQSHAPHLHRLQPAPASTPLIQRKCAACEEEEPIQRKASPDAGSQGIGPMPARVPGHGGGAEMLEGARGRPAPDIPSIVKDVLAASGQPLDASTRAMFEPRFGQDFSAVRVHTGGRAAESARAIRAMAYTRGSDIVFGGQYEPRTRDGQYLLAHELTHVVQQTRSSGGASGGMTLGAPDSAAEREADELARKVVDGERVAAIGAGNAGDVQRACLPASVCAGPIAGSSSEFGEQEEDAEAAARARRGRMSPRRQRASGHTGRARQLELFLEAQAPGLLANIHGIFIDQDLSRNTGALTMNCADMVPPITGATRPCVFVHGNLNQQALRFNTTSAATIGGESREDWRISTLQILTHEVQHVVFDTAVRPNPAGAAGCARADVEFELSELNAIISEFPIVFRAVPAAAAASDPTRRRLDGWFDSAITNPQEGIRGILKKLRCTCDCAQVDAWVIDTFNFVSSSWTPAERTAFNTELRSPVWGLGWPI
jgi:hypothetical protein